MFKMRVGLLALLALLITSGSVVSTASALNPSWKVNGVKLGAQVKKQIKLTASETELKGKVGGLASTIACTSATVENAYIEGNGTGAGQGGATGITFEKCTTTGLAHCAVNEPVKTSQIKSHLVTYGSGQGKIGELYESSQGGAFTELKFKGTECVVKPEQVFPVKGTVVAELRAIGQKQEQEPVESKIGELALPKQPITEVKLEGQVKKVGLAIGAETGAIFAGKFGGQLVSGESFGVFMG